MTFHKLSNKQRAFIHYYLVSWSPTDAARKAGYSPRSANVQGQQLLTTPAVRAEITKRLNYLQADADEVLTRLTDMARSDMGDFLDSNGNFDLKKATEDNRTHLIKRYRKTSTTFSPPRGIPYTVDTVELELYDAQAATVQLAHILGLHRVADNDDMRERLRAKLLALGQDPDSVLAKVRAVLAAPIEAPQQVVEGEYVVGNGQQH